MKKFTKAFLTNVVKMNEEDVQSVMKYQRLFPELLKNDEGFCVNGRVLWEQLDQPYTRYADWIKQKVLTQGWTIKQDYNRFQKSQKGDKKGFGNKTTKEYYFTVEMAKHVAMMENTECGHLVRQYFIKIEKALKEYQEHESIRYPEKVGYKEMCKVLFKQHIKVNGKPPVGRSLYSNNADMINVALLGKTAQQIKASLDIADTETRENLSIEANTAIAYLQQLNISLLITDMGLTERKEMITSTCKFRYKDLKHTIYKELDIAA